MSNVVKSGDLRHQVTLQQFTESKDQYGDVVQTPWTNVVTLAAYVQPASGTERMIASQIKAEVSHKVTLRYQGSGQPITPKQRFLFGSRVLNIVSSINLDERNHTIVVYCLEVT